MTKDRCVIEDKRWGDSTETELQALECLRALLKVFPPTNSSTS